MMFSMGLCNIQFEIYLFSSYHLVNIVASLADDIYKWILLNENDRIRI